MKTPGALGLAVAAAVGATAALSWSLSVWIALGSAPAGRDGAGPCDDGRAGACATELGRDAGGK